MINISSPNKQHSLKQHNNYCNIAKSLYNISTNNNKSKKLDTILPTKKQYKCSKYWVKRIYNNISLSNYKQHNNGNNDGNKFNITINKYNLGDNILKPELKIPDIADCKELLNKYVGSDKNMQTDAIYNMKIPDEIINKYPQFYINKLLYSEYVPNDIAIFINKNMKYVHEIYIKYNDDIIFTHILIYTSNTSNISNSIKDNKLINKIVHRILFFNMMYNIHEKNKLDSSKYKCKCKNVGKNKIIPPKTIFIYLTPYKKEIDSDDKNNTFSINCVNSAVTDGECIMIYREEEVLKSVCHELMHYYKFDIPFNKIPNSIIKKLVKLFNISSKNEYRLSEAITEVMANILNILFTIYDNYDNGRLDNHDRLIKYKTRNTQIYKTNKTYKTNITNITNKTYKNKQTLKKSVSKNIVISDMRLNNLFETLYLDELRFSIINVAKILILLGYKSWYEFCDISNINESKKLVQSTSVFSYHIIKCILLWDISNYLKNCICAYGIQFINTNDNMKCMFNIINDIREDRKFNNAVDNAINNINGLKLKTNTKKHSKLIVNTFRMTCLDN